MAILTQSGTFSNLSKTDAKTNIIIMIKMVSIKVDCILSVSGGYFSKVIILELQYMKSCRDIAAKVFWGLV
jgi:hypothetical protein